jgi:hypothetical protein
MMRSRRRAVPFDERVIGEIGETIGADSRLHEGCARASSFDEQFFGARECILLVTLSACRAPSRGQARH